MLSIDAATEPLLFLLVLVYIYFLKNVNTVILHGKAHLVNGVRMVRMDKDVQKDVNVEKLKGTFTLRTTVI